MVPTLNEGDYLARTLRCLAVLEPQPLEVIVVDGGSTDETVAIATQSQAKLIHSPQARRSVQMNLGAEVASGEILCFVHGDTLVPDDLIAVIQSVLAESRVVCGAFLSVMTGARSICWGITLQNWAKTYWVPILLRPYLFWRYGMRLFFGDQAIFCWRQAFWDCGAFNAAMPIMEESEFCQRVTCYGQMRLVHRVVQASDRRVAQLGVVKANAIYLMVGFLWAFGVPATRLKQLYAEIR